MASKDKLTSAERKTLFREVKFPIRVLVCRIVNSEYRESLLSGMNSEYCSLKYDACVEELYKRISWYLSSVRAPETTDDSVVDDALYTIILNVSSPEERALACRQLDAYPGRAEMCCPGRTHRDRNMKYVRNAIYRAIDTIVKRVHDLEVFWCDSKEEK